MDPRTTKLAKVLVNHSTKIKKGDTVLIDADLAGRPLAFETYKQAIKKEAYPLLRIYLPEAAYFYYKNATPKQLRTFPKISHYEVQNSDVCISIAATNNVKALTNIQPERIATRAKAAYAISEERLKKRWVNVAYPTNSFAQEAEMSIQEFQDFLYKACLVNWNNLSKKCKTYKRSSTMEKK